MSNDGFTPEEEHARSIRSRKLLTYLILFAIVMFFAGLTSAYVVSMSSGYWVDFKLPEAFLWSTGFIVLSSLILQLGLTAARKGHEKRVPIAVALTLLFGIAFTASQFKGWGELVSKGNYVVGKMVNVTGQYGVDYTIMKNGVPLELQDGQFYMPDDLTRQRSLNPEIDEQRNTSSSYFYVLTGAHLAHLAFGLLALVVMLIMALMGRYSAKDHAGLWAGTIYWHFLGGLWVYLLLFLAFIH